MDRYTFFQLLEGRDEGKFAAMGNAAAARRASGVPGLGNEFRQNTKSRLKGIAKDMRNFGRRVGRGIKGNAKAVGAGVVSTGALAMGARHIMKRRAAAAQAAQAAQAASRMRKLKIGGAIGAGVGAGVAGLTFLRRKDKDKKRR